MKKKLLAVAVLVICLSIISAGTWAAFTAEGRATNVITTGSVEVELVETHDGAPWPENGVTGVMPGTDVSKVVTVKNNSASAYVRIKVETSIVGPANPDMSLLHIDFNTTDWVLRDGFYYYVGGEHNGRLDKDDETTELFTKVSFDATMGNEYQNSKAEVAVSVQAVQFDNQNVQNPWDALGWPEA